MKEAILCELPAVFAEGEMDYIVLNIAEIISFNRSEDERYTRIICSNSSEIIIDMRYEDFKKFLINKGISITSISEVLNVEKIEQ